MFSVFNGLQMAIGTLPYGIRMLTETHVVLRRIQVSSSRYSFIRVVFESPVSVSEPANVR